MAPSEPPAPLEPAESSPQAGEALGCLVGDDASCSLGGRGRAGGGSASGGGCCSCCAAAAPGGEACGEACGSEARGEALAPQPLSLLPRHRLFSAAPPRPAPPSLLPGRGAADGDGSATPPLECARRRRPNATAGAASPTDDARRGSPVRATGVAAGEPRSEALPCEARPEALESMTTTSAPRGKSSGRGTAASAPLGASRSVKMRRSCGTQPAVR